MLNDSPNRSILATPAANRRADVMVRGARVVDPIIGTDEYADVSIRAGVIVGIGQHLSRSPEQREVVLDQRGTGSQGVVMAPAFIDPHVHLRVPGGSEVESIASGTAAAARGGYCAIVSMPNTNPVVDTPEMIGALRGQAAQQACLPVGFAAAISVGQLGQELTEMWALAEAGAALFTDDGKPVRSATLLRRALQYQLVAGRPIALHSEDPDLSGAGVMHEGAVSAQLGMQGIPAASEWVSIARDVRLAQVEQAALHLQHLSTAESVAEVAAARERGAQVTAEVTPHHLLLTDEFVWSCDANWKMNPPLRDERHRVALVEGLRSGDIEMIATDHAPHAPESKEQPFEAAPFGVIGLETAFAAVFTGLVSPGILPLTTVLRAMSHAPAQLLGLEAPRVQVGARANLTLIDLDAEWQVDPRSGASLSRNTPFAGRTVRGQTVLTIADGCVVYDATANDHSAGSAARPAQALAGARS